MVRRYRLAKVGNYEIFSVKFITIINNQDWITSAFSYSGHLEIIRDLLLGCLWFPSNKASDTDKITIGLGRRIVVKWSQLSNSPNADGAIILFQIYRLLRSSAMILDVLLVMLMFITVVFVIIMSWTFEFNLTYLKTCFFCVFC